MAQITINEKRWNQKYEYTQVDLISRETVKENEIIPIVESITAEAQEIDICYLWGITGECYNIDTDKNVINIKFASRKQLNRFTDYMTGLCTGEITEKYCR